MSARRKKFLTVWLVGVLVGLGLVLYAYQGPVAATPAAPAAPKPFDPVAAAKKWQQPPPPPPPKVNPDGTPWVPVDQVAALKRAHEVPPLVVKTLEETQRERRLRLGDKMPKMADMKYPYLVLDNPMVNKEGDLYEAVRFMHKKHAAVLEGQCFTCHHAKPAAKDASETTRCVACHQSSFNPELPGRLGLKAALHRQCMGCHEKRKQGPVGCTDCHAKKVPDHRKLVKLPDKPGPLEVTKECLRCHQDAANHLQSAAHWQWKGPSPFTVNGEKRIDMGKATNTINNFCVALPSNWPRCTSCHAGYGWSNAEFDFNDQSRMDCLVCHDTTGTYSKVPTAAGWPFLELDFKKIAQSVGHPSRKNCGDCHFQGGGGDAVKHGDMNGILYYPSKSCDVHMGGMDFACQECHKTRNHKISGRSLSLPVAEGSRTCQDCHTNKPHNGNSLLDHHLNRHVEHLFCVTCHSPVYAKCRATKTWWDWSKAGRKERKPKKDRYGMPDYDWKKGEFLWKESMKPAYAWYNGKVERVLLGDKIDTSKVVDITKPVGGFRDPASRIYPFKLMEGKQAADAVNKLLLVPHLYGPGGFWATIGKTKTPVPDKVIDQAWNKAFVKGMAESIKVNPNNKGLKPYSGQYQWVQTRMYWGLTHETMPAKAALGCAQCHESLAKDKTCCRCHKDERHVDFKKLAHRGTDFEWMKKQGRDVHELIGKTDYLNFKALGYKGDPIVYGGRLKKLPLASTIDRECK
ncbi:MAG: tetrathionate reductase family octaheme c-type cytochrome [Desulfarculaceae bacterium]|nr:tetrathionate reductase family octaheme c-type cytochrome [Desulfarculaceae bacterium]